MKYRIGKNVDHDKLVEVDLLEDLATHALISGRTGRGKSRVIAGLADACIKAGISVVMMEGSGDGCDDLLARFGRRVAETGDKAVLNKLHYLRASPAQCFRYDLFRMPTFNVHPELQASYRRAWIHAKVQSRMEVYQSITRGTEGFQGMPRLQRVFTDVLTAVAVQVDGKRIAVGDADILLDLTHEKHFEIFEKLRPFLPREVQADYETIHAMARVEDLRRETESTINTLRSFGPIMKAILSGTGEEPSVDLFRIIQSGGCMLVPLQDEFLSNDQKTCLAAMIFHDVIDTLIHTPRHLRKPCVIFLDEVAELILACGERLNRAMGMLRKYRGMIVIGTQDLNSLTRGELYLRPKILSQAGLKITFEQTWPDDAMIMAQVMYAGNRSWEQIVNELERWGGIDWMNVPTTTRQWSTQKSRAVSDTASISETTSRSTSIQTGKTSGSGEGTSEQAAMGDVETLSRPRNGQSNRPEQESKAKSRTNAKGSSRTTTESTSQTNGVTDGTANMQGNSHSVQEGTTQGEGGSVADRPTMVPRPPIREKVETGMLKDPNQLDKFVQKIMTLGRRQAIVRLPNERIAFEIFTADVPDAFASIEAQMKVVEWVKRELYAIHPYFFTPILDDSEREKRIREFLQNWPADDVRPDVVIGRGGDDNAYGN